MPGGKRPASSLALTLRMSRVTPPLSLSVSACGVAGCSLPFLPLPFNSHNKQRLLPCAVFNNWYFLNEAHSLRCVVPNESSCMYCRLIVALKRLRNCFIKSKWQRDAEATNQVNVALSLKKKAFSSALRNAGSHDRPLTAIVSGRFWRVVHYFLIFSQSVLINVDRQTWGRGNVPLIPRPCVNVSLRKLKRN